MPPLDVCAAVIRRAGKILLATRPPGCGMAGKWEFPGGKVHPGESHQACIAREIAEELGLTVRQAAFLTTIVHEDAARTLRLHFLECTVDPTQQPIGHDGQEARWFTPGELDGLDLAPADRDFAARHLRPAEAGV